MRARLAVLVLAGAASSGPANALNTDDYAAMMGMLWRFQTPVCPSMSFDPATFVRALKLPGGTPAAVRRAHRAAFERGYAITTDWLGKGTTAEGCKAIEDFVDGKHTLGGELKAAPEPPAPGLTIRP